MFRDIGLEPCECLFRPNRSPMDWTKRLLQPIVAIASRCIAIALAWQIRVSLYESPRYGQNPYNGRMLCQVADRNNETVIVLRSI